MTDPELAAPAPSGGLLKIFHPVWRGIVGGGVLDIDENGAQTILTRLCFRIIR